MTIDLGIAIAERMPVIFDQRRRKSRSHHLPSISQPFRVRVRIGKKQTTAPLWPRWTGAPCSQQRTWAENELFKCFRSRCHQNPPLQHHSFVQMNGLGRGCAPSFSAHVRCCEPGAPVRRGHKGAVVCFSQFSHRLFRAGLTFGWPALRASRNCWVADFIVTAHRVTA